MSGSAAFRQMLDVTVRALESQMADGAMAAATAQSDQLRAESNAHVPPEVTGILMYLGLMEQFLGRPLIGPDELEKHVIALAVVHRVTR